MPKAYGYNKKSKIKIKVGGNKIKNRKAKKIWK
jgi:hypothetical protein